MSISKIIWMADGVIEKTHPTKWNEALTLADELVATIGKRNLTHTVIDPISGFRSLSYQLKGQRFSTIIDLSGWLGNGLQPLFPDADLLTDFSLSRIMDCSTQNLQAAGYVTTMSDKDIAQRQKGMDLSRTLIIDDTGFSGDTSKLVMDLWNIKYENATHAFLVANTGYLSSNDGETTKPAAVKYLQGLGSRVVYGDEITSPKDDAWHLRDTFDHPDIETGFTSAVKLFDNSAEEENPAAGRVNYELYPQEVSVEDIHRLIEEGRFIRHPKYSPSEGSIFVINPFLWATRGFRKAIDEVNVKSHESEVGYLLKRLNSIANEPKGLPAVTQALRAEIQGSIIEGHRPGISRGERMI